MDRHQMADLIVARLRKDRVALRESWLASGAVSHFVVDDLLPPEVAAAIRRAFPAGDSMKTRRSLRELKFVAAQMDRHDPLLEEAIYAFQDPRIVAAIGEITGLGGLEPDEQLYAGGISMMVRGHFLNPHVDNSHDIARDRYRVLNLLYYVSPDWRRENGGNLELWPDGTAGAPTIVDACFNRLAVMVTNKRSWHSVSPVCVEHARCCVSNYYFSKASPESGDYFHVTSFRGRPGQRLRDLVLRLDGTLRMGLRRLFPHGVVKVSHFYERKRDRK